MTKNTIKVSTAVAVFTAMVGLNIIKKALELDSRVKKFKSIKDAKAVKIDINVKELL